MGQCRDRLFWARGPSPFTSMCAGDRESNRLQKRRPEQLVWAENLPARGPYLCNHRARLGGENGICGMVAGMFVLGFVWYSVAPVSAEAFFAVFERPGGRAFDIIMTSFVAALVGGFVVGASGSSIGKAIFGIKVVDANLHAIGIVKGVGREFQVWLIGISLGIPIIALFTLIAAYRRLKRDGVTLWDRERYVVLQRPSGPLQNLLNIFGILLCIVAAVFVRYLASLRVRIASTRARRKTRPTSTPLWQIRKRRPYRQELTTTQTLASVRLIFSRFSRLPQCSRFVPGTLASRRSQSLHSFIGTWD
jgi:hypothetical protein